MAWTTFGGRARLALACAVLLFPACGGGNSPAAPTPPAPPPPPPPAPRVVAEGAGSIPAEEVGFVSFTTTAAGKLDVTVDWTFATNDIDIFIVKGTCTDDQLISGQCPALAISASDTAKPERLSVASAATGSYTLYAVNFGPGDESASFQAVLTPSASGTAASQSARSGLTMALKRPLRGVRRLR